ncbi:MAG: lipopolysaccharide biosynthesis protein [Acidobacteria bacterium]|nr:lipopolysaccharide biosynthesis protein [Acidobacteriota bacterium]
MLANVRRVFSHLAVYGSGEILLFGIGFLLFPVYTRVLTLEEYGVLGLLLALRAFLRPLNQLGLDESFLRFYYDCGDDAARRTLTGTTLVAIGLASGLVLTVLLAGADTFSRLLLGSAEHAWTLRLLALNGFLQAFLCVPHGLLRIRNEPARFARWTVGGGLGATAGRLLLVVGFRMSVFGIMLADLLVSVVLVAGLSRVVEWPLGRFSWRRAREMLRYGLPRVPNVLLQQVTMMSDRFFVRIYRSPAEIGIYQSGATVANVLRIYPEAFRRAWMPFAFEKLDQPDAPRQFAQLATVAFAVLVYGTLGIAVLAGPVVQFLAPPPFHGAATIVPFLVLGVAFHGAAVFLTTSLNVAKRTRALPVAAAVAAAVTVVGHVTLIPRFGLLGAAGATAAGQAARVIVMTVAAQRLYHIPYETGPLLRTALVGLVFYGAAGFAPADVSAEALLVRGGLLALFPPALLLAGVVDRDALRRLRARAAGQSAPPPSEPGELE